MYYKIIMETGHVGAGKSLERVKYCKGDDILSMFRKAHAFPRVKKKNRRKGVILIQEISRLEYLKGLNTLNDWRPISFR